MGKNLAEAFRALSSACLDVAAALEREPVVQRDSKPEKRDAALRAPKAPPVLKLSAADAEESEDALKPASLRILAALATAAGALSKSQICVRAGLTYNSSTTDKALAELRGGAFIATEGHSNTITELGLGCAYPELPTGHALFEYWLEQVGGRARPAARVLLALRSALRDGKAALSKDEICKLSGLTYNSSTTDKALAKVRRLELVQTSGHSNELHPDLREALQPTIGVFDTKTGKSTRVKVG